MTVSALPLAGQSEEQGTGRRGGGGVESEESFPAFAMLPSGSIDPKNLTRPKLFMHQWDLWVLEDLMAAVRLANTGPDGKLLNVTKAPVKRIDSVVLRNPESMLSLDPIAPREDGTSFTEPAAPTETVPGITAIDRSMSFSGRVRGGWNQTYEVRRAEITMVVASQQLKRVLAAISQANYMTVTDLDIDTSVDVWTELGEGYFYGDEHVVRVRLSIESLWLKQWLKPLMPAEVRKALHMPEDAPPPQ
jgi:hypothetical protein